MYNSSAFIKKCRFVEVKHRDPSVKHVKISVEMHIDWRTLRAILYVNSCQTESF